MAQINVFLVDPDTFDDIPIGSITIDGDKITSSNDDLLLDLAYASGDSPEEILRVLSDWSNGYLRSELATEPLRASGAIKLAEEPEQEETSASGSIKLVAVDHDPEPEETGASGSITLTTIDHVPEPEEPIPSGTIKLTPSDHEAEGPLPPETQEANHG